MSVSLINSFVRAPYVAPPGEVVFNTIPASTDPHWWTCPDGVTSVSVICIGGGGAGNHGQGGWDSMFLPNIYGGAGGGGGGVGWKNNIIVIPGQVYDVFVGEGGYDLPGSWTTSGVSSTRHKAEDGQNSYFISNTTVCGSGGIGAGGDNVEGNNGGAGGGYLGDGGGAGGTGGTARYYETSPGNPKWLSGGGGGGGG